MSIVTANNSKFDKNNILIKYNDHVIVDDPTDMSDVWNHSFQGVVIGFHGAYVTIEDGDAYCWDVEPHKITVTD